MRPTRRAAAQLPLGRPLRERPRRRPGLGRADAGLPRHGAAVAAAGPGAPTPSRSTTPTAHILETEELTILTGWAEGVAEAAAYAPERINAVLADAHADATWRAEFGLPHPSPRLADAMESLSRVVHAATDVPPGTPRYDELLTALSNDHPDETRLD